jgi:ribosomal protein S18 acetylase RimI-like enzyme
MRVVVVPVRAVTAELVAAFERLLPQLSPGLPPLEARDLAEIVDSPATALFVAHDRGDDVGSDAGAVVGAVTLVLFRIPSGLRARIESLVVDRAARGRGVGEALCRAALARARERGAATVDLTSAPSRHTANGLYQRLGFTLRATNVYRYSFAMGT